ncbi:hypothetical protein Tco_0876647 [Tanacetum coccineum]|uniref:Uncharacterized protein n=1 Tax=Tanacetum coccineum TaxID=301880 RepID=A0ABQ5BVL4_9ASTR
MNQEVTHQVAARDKNYKAFTISAKVPEIFMHQFWYTVKKVSGSNSYEFLLANKKYVVDVEEYGLPIPETMLTGGIKKSESYRMFIKYSTGQIPSKKSRGKGSHGKKTADTTKETMDVSEESDSEPTRK